MIDKDDLQIFEDRISKIECEIAKIAERNNRVELNKGWETSLSRFFLIVITTYFVMCLVFTGMGSEASYLNAVVPTLGYALSTVSFSFFKKLWISGRK